MRKPRCDYLHPALKGAVINMTVTRNNDTVQAVFLFLIKNNSIITFYLSHNLQPSALSLFFVNSLLESLQIELQISIFIILRQSNTLHFLCQWSSYLSGVLVGIQSNLLLVTTPIIKSSQHYHIHITSIMLLIRAKKGARGKAETKIVTKPYWITISRYSSNRAIWFQPFTTQNY